MMPMRLDLIHHEHHISHIPFVGFQPTIALLGSLQTFFGYIQDKIFC